MKTPTQTLIFLVLISMAMGGIYFKNNVQQVIEARLAPIKLAPMKIAPIIIGSNGVVRYPERVPSPETVFQIRSAVETEDYAALNNLLIKNRFYALPAELHTL